MSHSCHSLTRPPVQALPQDRPQNSHHPPRAQHHLRCRNTSSVLLLLIKVCCYSSKGTPMFRNERIIAKFCLFTKSHKKNQRRAIQLNGNSFGWDREYETTSTS